MSVERAKVFDETYRRYLQEIRQLDFLAKAEILGVKTENGALKIPLFNKIYRFGADGIVGGDGEDLTPAVQVMICKYILTCPLELPQLSETLVTYREFKDAGPLISYFTTNTNKTLESTFSGNIAGLKKRGQEIGGKILESDTYDLSLQFRAFPRVPVILNFNDRDDLFSATCSVLYQSSAAHFLDMECLAMTGTLLTGKLIGTKTFA
ncbi:MAG: DUF3786 domain-containing protein [Desulforhopalus sp.]|nr:DUF3786 domain-containing protein [Desulforhopalus sp.]